MSICNLQIETFENQLSKLEYVTSIENDKFPIDFDYDFNGLSYPALLYYSYEFISNLDKLNLLTQEINNFNNANVNLKYKCTVLICYHVACLVKIYDNDTYIIISSENLEHIKEIYANTFNTLILHLQGKNNKYNHIQTHHLQCKLKKIMENIINV